MRGFNLPLQTFDLSDQKQIRQSADHGNARHIDDGRREVAFADQVTDHGWRNESGRIADEINKPLLIGDLRASPSEAPRRSSQSDAMDDIHRRCRRSMRWQQKIAQGNGQ
jgi:hypothetical protein